MERILRSAGDHPDHPYCIKAAFTGTAAANIKGQTLHSAFSFSFGNEFYSLSDKLRDERREQLSNLCVDLLTASSSCAPSQVNRLAQRSFMRNS